MKKILLLCIGLGVTSTFAQEIKKDSKQKPQKHKMELVKVFDAGQPDAGIFKLYDKESDVICYILSPDLALRRGGADGWSYESNTIGSISCLKNRQVVVPIPPQSNPNAK